MFYRSISCVKTTDELCFHIITQKYNVANGVDSNP